MAMRTLPETDAGLLVWSLGFSNSINSAPEAFGLTPLLASQYAANHELFKTAMAGVEPGVRCKSSVTEKNAARKSLRDNAVMLIRIIQATTSVTAAQKQGLGIRVRRPATPSPVPDGAPGMTVISVRGWTVKVRLYDGATTGHRGKPPRVIGASWFTFIGDEPPADVGLWRFNGNTGRTAIEFTFPSSLPPGARVWMTARWFNGRKQGGPMSQPVGTNLQGGSVVNTSKLAA
jgi:hypothetical protein